LDCSVILLLRAEVGDREIAGVVKHRPGGGAEHPHMKVVSYTPEIKDIQIVDGIAYEWDYFDASFSESGTSNDVQALRAKALRILKRQLDGSWKFSRVMWNLAEGQTLPK
jgi:hypothetical protein